MHFTRSNQLQRYRLFATTEDRFGMRDHRDWRHCKTNVHFDALHAHRSCILVLSQEVGHAGGAQSHANGFKIDISLNSCVNSYITGAFPFIGYRGDGAAQYRAASGNVYAKESNHWDITFVASC
jgi:hypothetical protein